MSRLRRIADTDRIFFVTTNLDPGVANLSPAERDIVLDWLAKVRARYEFLLLGYVVMPDHVHILLAVILSSLPEIVRGWKSHTARVIQRDRGKSGSLWQARYFDFICRRTRDVSNKLEYIHDNPVKAGLARRPSDWRWSSAAFYAGEGNAPVIPDAIDFSGDPDELLWPAPWRRK
jgi:putative transposase